MSRGNVGAKAASDLAADLIICKILDYLAVLNPKLWDTLSNLVAQKRFLTHGGLIVAAEAMALIKDQLGFLPSWMHKIMDAALEQCPMTIVNYYRQRGPRQIVAAKFRLGGNNEAGVVQYIDQHVPQSPVAKFELSVRRSIQKAGSSVADVLGELNITLEERRRKRLNAQRKQMIHDRLKRYWYWTIGLTLVALSMVNEGLGKMPTSYRYPLILVMALGVGVLLWWQYPSYKSMSIKSVDEKIAE